ncbi:MAG TPA: thioredoxin domain-containing protein [Bacillota bacterium]
MTTNEHNKPNRLITEKSPYLLQHAYNPVDWYPWGEEAFQRAKEENKSIFLSIGYSTCHWCHVMARESFEDEEIAAYLNKHYISIKVDREERPDIDSIYMKVCQMMTGHGGWPLTIVMTPDEVPFFAGTYFPKKNAYGMPSMMEVLQHVHHTYTNDPTHIEEVTERVHEALHETVQTKSTHRLTKTAADEAFHQLERKFDFTNGGFGAAPKFPQPHNLLFLLHYYYFTGKKAALKMVEYTLQKMAAGGIYDHVGFGFCRYSTDEKWLIPHFEKMLYDNALLLYTYTQCFAVTKSPFYKQISEQIIQFIRREMTSTEGAFYSAIDADSEGVEGKYYVWEDEEIFDILGEELGERYAYAYNITPVGNFQTKNIPNTLQTNFEQIAIQYNLPLDTLHEQLEEARQKLLTAREKRVYPHIDDKILTSWNGLMIAALANAGKVFNEKMYVQQAERALHFIEKHLFQEGRLMARYRDQETKYKAYIDDYAFLLWAYIELYEATFSVAYLQKGKQLLDQMIDLFWDSELGGFYFTGKDAEQLIAKDKEVYDGALPSGNSTAAVMLVKMSSLTGELTYVDYVNHMYRTFFNDIDRQASAGAFFVQSLLLTEYPTKEIVLFLPLTNETKEQKILNKLQQAFLPDVSILVAQHKSEFVDVAPFAAQYKPIDDKPTLYMCEHFSCQSPTTEVNEEIERLIKGTHR